MKKLMLIPVFVFGFIVAKANIGGPGSVKSTVARSATFTASATYDIYYLSGSASVVCGYTTPPNYDFSSIAIYCDQYGANLPVITSISHSVSGGFYNDDFVASTPDGVYNVYFTIYGETNGNSGYIIVTDTEYVPA